jgi:hypothetical protein
MQQLIAKIVPVTILFRIGGFMGFLFDFGSSDFVEIHEKEISKTTVLINNRPRKCLSCRTPRELL